MKSNIVSIEDINPMHVVYYFQFCRWLDDNGWQSYVGDEMWINLSEGNRLMSIKYLFTEFLKENPQP
jgi:hypothetical protein